MRGSRAAGVAMMAPVATDLRTERSTLRRKKERGHFDRATVHAILDEALVCHVGFTVDGGTVVLPTAFARIGDVFYLHGATGNGMLRALASGLEACVTVTILDGLVLSRSAFHHSMNYRSVVLFGTVERVTDEAEQRDALAALLDHTAPGRSVDARVPTAEELRAVLVLRFPIVEGSAKIRTGGPKEESVDLGLPIWGGHIPLTVVAGAPVADEHHSSAAPTPDYARPWERS